MSSSSNSSSSAKALVVSSALVGVAAYTAFRTTRALSAPSVPAKYSIARPGQEGEADEGGKIRISPNDVPAEELCRSYLPAYQGTMTTWSLFKNTAEKFATRPFHGTLGGDKAWRWESYADVLRDVEQLGRGMERLGLLSLAKNDPKMRVFGLFGPNSSNWVKCEYAAVSRNATTVTLYATLNQEGVAHVLNLTGVETVMCGSLDCARRCLASKRVASTLKTILVVERTKELEELASREDVRLLSMDDVRVAGKEPNESSSASSSSRSSGIGGEPTPEDVFTFCFTSGSTGLPKGALITHKSFVINVAATAGSIQQVPVLKPGEERYLSFLPLAHQMERVIQLMLVSWGARVGFSRGDPALIMEDIALLKPTFFATVPRLLTRLYDGIRTKANAAGGIKTKLFNYALKSKLHDLAEYKLFTHPIWDKIVFSKIRKQLGLDECHYVATGSAPVAPRVLDFLRVVLCCRVVEGYGQTEGTCTMTLAHPLDAGGPDERISHVGAPLATVELKLRSIPEMQYLTTDRLHDGSIPVVGRGEVLCRGPSVMRGYFALKEKTAETIDSEGWLRTGDVGAWLPNGTLCIIDRANNIFKTAQGEYIQVEKVERAVSRVPVVASCFVFGTSLNAKLVAILVLNPEALPVYCKTKQCSETDLVALKNIVAEDVKLACKQAGLLGYEIPAAFNLQTKPFSIESGVLTATSKLVRGVAKQFFKAEIVQLYKELGEEVKL